MEVAGNQYRPQDGAVGTEEPPTTGATGAPQFTNSFAPGETEARVEEPLGHEGRGSQDFSNTDEWDASKVPPSRFQQRKGSIYSTPASRDGHVGKHSDRDQAFHEKHTSMFDKAKKKVKEAVGGGAAEGGSASGHRRGSSSASK